MPCASPFRCAVRVVLILGRYRWTTRQYLGTSAGEPAELWNVEDRGSHEALRHNTPGVSSRGKGDVLMRAGRRTGDGQSAVMLVLIYRRYDRQTFEERMATGYAVARE